MEELKRIPKEERYGLIDRYVSKSTGEYVDLDEPMEIELKSNGKASPVDGKLFNKVYKDRMLDIAKACSEHGDSFHFLEFVSHNLENYKFQSVCCSIKNLAEIFGWSRVKVYRVIDVLVKHKLMHTFTLYKSTHFVIDCDVMWDKAENVKWKGVKAKEGDFRTIRSKIIIKEEDIKMNRERVKKNQ